MSALDFEAVVRQTLTSEALHLRTRVYHAVMVLTSEGQLATRDTVAQVTNSGPRTIERHLYKLRDAGLLVGLTGGIYRLNHEGPSAKPADGPQNLRTDSAEPADRPQNLRTDDHLETTYIFPPKGGKEDARATRAREGAYPAPTSLPSSGQGEQDLQAIILAWEQLPRRRGPDGRPQSTWILSARRDDVHALQKLVEGYGAEMVLRAVCDIGERSHTYRHPPRVHYIAERCERLDQERAIAEAKAEAAGDFPPGMDRTFIEATNYDERAAVIAFCDAYYGEADVLAWMVARRTDPDLAKILIHAEIPPAMRVECMAIIGDKR